MSIGFSGLGPPKHSARIEEPYQLDSHKQMQAEVSTLNSRALLDETNRLCCLAIEASANATGDIGAPVSVWSKLAEMILDYAPLSSDKIETPEQLTLRHCMNNVLATRVILEELIANQHKRRL